MKFYIENVILWLKNGKLRTFDFEPNKVNVITGDSNTGKTAILEIIDYCFFASSSKISESVINENVDWYGIKIHINDKIYTIVRSSLNKGKVTNNYYFSSTGEIPNSIESNNSEKNIKSLIESEFSINNRVSIQYGGNSIKAGTKISLRYFLLFNTISGNIIENDSGIFFDKQNEARYREALPRIFDIALGIETVENILKKEKKVELEKELKKLQRKEIIIAKSSNDFISEYEELIKKAKEYALIDVKLNIEESISALEKISTELITKTTQNSDGGRERLERDRSIKQRKIRNLSNFTSEYSTYKTSLKKVEESLKPISYLKENDSELLKTSAFEEVITAFNEQLEEIKGSVKTKTPINNQVNDLVATLEKEIKEIDDKLAILPKENSLLETEAEKIFFLGEIKAKLQLYSKTEHGSNTSNNKTIGELKDKIDSLEILDTAEQKDLTIKLIEEIISEYIEETGNALENYAKYKPVFDYKEKSLKLRKPKTSFIEHIGSSSNYMFLHLFFSLAIQEVSYKNKSPFVAPFLIIDQPSRPYYGDEKQQKTEIDHSDESKITAAFVLLNQFIEERNEDSGDFQMIVFEHIPKRIFGEMGNIHLVKEFRDGNALIASTTT